MQRIPLRWSTVLGAFLLFTLTSSFTTQGNSQAASTQSNDSLQSKTVVRANTRLVVLDVVATDDKGEPVTSLKADDFTALEDGKPQTIRDFTFHRPAESAAPARQLPPEIASNAPIYTSNSSLNIILLDAINTDFSSHAYVQDMLIKYLGTGPAIQPTAVFALEGKLELLHDFTTDAQVLKEVLSHFKPQGPEHIPDVYTAASPFGHQGSFKASPNARQVTFNAMLFLSHSLKGYPGRKNLIWLSEGFPLNLFPDALMGDGVIQLEDYSPAVEKIADELMNAQVAVYPIDAAGVTPNDRFSARTAMESVAERTGGKTFFNRNDIDMGIRTSIDDGSTYYTLEYYPENKKWDSKFRHIEVKVNRPGVKLRYREGYYALGPYAETSDPAAEVSRSLDLNAPASTAVLFQARAVVPSEKGQKVLVQFHIDPHTLAFDHQSDALQHAGVSCMVWAYSGNGNPVRSEGDSSGALTPEQFQSVMKSYFPCNRPIDLKAGHYTLRLAVLDKTTNLVGSTSLQITVP